jgi:hypothetical protein
MQRRSSGKSLIVPQTENSTPALHTVMKGHERRKAVIRCLAVSFPVGEIATDEPKGLYGLSRLPLLRAFSIDWEPEDKA